jgi:hypothetical protein
MKGAEMKKSLLLALFVLCFASLAFAQLPGAVGLFADQAGTACELVDAPGIAYVYVVHNWTDGATASEFKVYFPASCMTHLADNSPFSLKSGNFLNGTSISYQSCLTGPIYLGSMLFNAAALCPPCTYMKVGENPNSLPAPLPGEVYVVDCNTTNPGLMKGTGGELIIRPDETCHCDVPAEDTTWGQVKALFE